MITAVAQVLDQVLNLLTDPASECRLDLQPCRVVLAPGLTATWDTCEDGCGPDGADGQLFANVGPVTTINQGNCYRMTWTATVGIVRCAAKPTGDGSTPPPVERVEQDAWRQASDADQIRHALQCCPTRPDSVRDLELVSWTPLGPQGGCVGGAWTIRGVLDGCC